MEFDPKSRCSVGEGSVGEIEASIDWGRERDKRVAGKSRMDEAFAKVGPSLTESRPTAEVVG